MPFDKPMPDVNSASLEEIRAWQRERHIHMSRELGGPLRLSAAMDGRTCQIGKAAHGLLFKPDDAPDFPLPGCDAAACRCLLTALSGRSEVRLIAEGRARWPAAATDPFLSSGRRDVL